MAIKIATESPRQWNNVGEWDRREERGKERRRIKTKNRKQRLNTGISEGISFCGEVQFDFTWTSKKEIAIFDFIFRRKRELNGGAFHQRVPKEKSSPRKTSNASHDRSPWGASFFSTLLRQGREGQEEGGEEKRREGGGGEKAENGTNWRKRRTDVCSCWFTVELMKCSSVACGVWPHKRWRQDPTITREPVVRELAPQKRSFSKKGKENEINHSGT